MSCLVSKWGATVCPSVIVWTATNLSSFSWGYCNEKISCLFRTFSNCGSKLNWLYFWFFICVKTDSLWYFSSYGTESTERIIVSFSSNWNADNETSKLVIELTGETKLWDIP